MQALKGHVQEYPGCQKLEVVRRAEQDGGVRVHCYTTWDTPEQLEAFLERGYTFERMLADVADSARADTRDGEDLLMARDAGRSAAPGPPARRLPRHRRGGGAQLAPAVDPLLDHPALIVLYLGWTLTIYFLEPGLR